ncbi:MAG: hypothetical protein MMC33_008851 [Icmadophila ericetorum]|nr:hypothetical protein [Icmadophila ericetorum]
MASFFGGSAGFTNAAAPVPIYNPAAESQYPPPDAYPPDYQPARSSTPLDFFSSRLASTEITLPGNAAINTEISGQATSSHNSRRNHSQEGSWGRSRERDERPVRQQERTPSRERLSVVGEEEGEGEVRRPKSYQSVRQIHDLIPDDLATSPPENSGN